MVRDSSRFYKGAMQIDELKQTSANAQIEIERSHKERNACKR
jgi:hypothetical protein